MAHDVPAPPEQIPDWQVAPVTQRFDGSSQLGEVDHAKPLLVGVQYAVNQFWESVQGELSQSWLLAQVEPQVTPQRTPLLVCSHTLSGQLIAAHSSENVEPELDELVEVEVVAAAVVVEVDVVAAAVAVVDVEAAVVTAVVPDDEELATAVPVEEVLDEEWLDVLPVVEVLAEEELEGRPEEEPEERPVPAVEPVIETWITPELEASPVVEPVVLAGTHRPEALQISSLEWQSELTAHSTSQVPPSAPLATMQLP